MDNLHPLTQYVAPATEVIDCRIETSVLIGSPTGENYNEPVPYGGFTTYYEGLL